MPIVRLSVKHGMETSVDGHRIQRDLCAAMSSGGDLQLALASIGDVGKVFSMVNTAYKVEDGDTGVAFKKTDRFLTHDEGEEHSHAFKNAFALIPLHSSAIADRRPCFPRRSSCSAPRRSWMHHLEHI